MKQLFIFLILSVAVLDVFSQNDKFQDEQIDTMMQQASRYVPGFHPDSVVAYYPIWRLLTKEEYVKKEFDKIPTYKEVEPYLDFENLELHEIIAKTTTKTWSLFGMYYDADGFEYGDADYDKHTLGLILYLDSVKPDKVYFLFGAYANILVEKDGIRYLIDDDGNSFHKSDLPNMNNPNHVYFFNHNEFQNRSKKILLRGY